MNSVQSLYLYLKLSLKSFAVIDSVTLSIFYGRVLVLLMLVATIVGFVFHSTTDFILVQKLFLFLVALHAYEGLSLILDDYVKNSFSNHLFKSFIFLTWLCFFCS